MEIRTIAYGFKNNENLFDNLDENIEKNIGMVLHQLATDVVMEAKQNVGNNQSIDRGTLIFSIRILEEDYGKSVTIGTDAPYAEYIEFGRGPVRPVNAEVLHFFTKDGNEVFTKYSGPTEPQPFLEPAVIKVTGKFSDIYAEIQGDFINKLATSLLDAELI